MNGRRSRARAVSGIVLGLALLFVEAGSAFAQSQAESLSASFQKALGRVAPALVAIRPLDSPHPFVPVPLPPVRPLRLGELIPRVGVRVGEPEGEPLGTGLVIDLDRGYILTCDHVLRGSSQAAAIFADGRERLTSEIRRDPRLDLAVLLFDLKGLNLSQAEWGDPSALHPGDWVLSIGQPAGSAPAISAGIFSAFRPGVGIAPADELLETDARVNPLNSGGPMVNLKGEVVGINVTLPGRRGGLTGMGYAVPADRARRVATDLAEFGHVRRAYLGVQVEPVQPASPDRPMDAGPLVVVNVNPGTPASEAGLRPGDRIVSIDGRAIAGVAMLQAAVELAPIGEELALTVDRDGQRLELKVRARAQPSSPGLGGPVPGSRIESENRRDSARGRKIPRDSSRTRPPAPLPNVPPSDGAPSSLDPIPARDRPPPPPSVESPNNSTGESVP